MAPQGRLKGIVRNSETGTLHFRLVTKLFSIGSQLPAGKLYVKLSDYKMYTQYLIIGEPYSNGATQLISI